MSPLRITPPFLYTAGAILPPVCAAVVAARFLTRRAQRAQLGWDDWLVLPALFLVCGIAAAVLAGTALQSLGYPTPVPSPDMALVATSYQQTVTRKIYWTVMVVQTAALCLIKTSCILFYRRVFSTSSSRVINISSVILLAITILWGVSLFFGFFFLCGTHFDYLWTNIVNQDKCASASMMNQAIAVSDVITDLMIMIFPIPLIWRLGMSLRYKLAVTAIFFAGTLAITASIARMVIIYLERSAEYSKSSDEDFVSTAGIYFMFIEASFGLCTICLPTLYGGLKLKTFQNFIYGFQSLSPFHQSREQDLHDSENLHQELNFLHSGSEVTHSIQTLEEGLQSVEMKAGKNFKVTGNLEHTVSMA